jgi:hypothetical protein
VHLLVFHAYINEMHGSSSKIPSKILFRQRCAEEFNFGIKGLRASPLLCFGAIITNHYVNQTANRNYYHVRYSTKHKLIFCLHFWKWAVESSPNYVCLAGLMS